jgi:hypothetical protein
MQNQAVIFGILSQPPIDETMQNFINIHTLNLENVQSYKKKEKGEVAGCQVSSNYMSKSLRVKNQPSGISWPYFFVSKIDRL